MAVRVLLHGTAATTGFIDEVLVKFALIGTNMLACRNAEATFCVALTCDRETQDSVLGIKVHTSMYVAVLKMPHCKGIIGGAKLVMLCHVTWA